MDEDVDEDKQDIGIKYGDDSVNDKINSNKCANE